MRRIFLLALLPLFLAPLPGGTLDFWDPVPPEELAAALAEAMTDRELLGQVLLLGYPSTYANKNILKWITHRGVGGIKIFGWNVGDLPSLAHAVDVMQQKSQTTRFRVPLFMVTDQEGGWVRHIARGTSETPGNMAIGATGLPWDAYQTGYYIGRELRRLGINMNFAPTVDIYTNPEAHVIGPRAFSDDPLLTARLGVAYYRGMEQAGIICTAKHFPGHGNASEDSHGTLPMVPTDFETLWSRELLPFRFLLREGIPAVMSGHLAFPLIEDPPQPATLSSFFLTELLRDQMDFRGIVVTDDLIMYGVQNQGGGTAAICRRAMMAGNDLLLVSRTAATHENIWEELLPLMKHDPAFRARVREAAERCLEVKLRYLKGPEAVPLSPAGPEGNSVREEEGRAYFTDHAFRSTTLLRDRNLPLQPDEDDRVLIIGPLEEFLEEGLNYFPGAETIETAYSPFYYATDEDRERLGSLDLSRYDAIIFCLANLNGLELLKMLEPQRDKVSVISILTPIYLKDLPWVSNAVAVYGMGPDSLRSGFLTLTGALKGGGRLPIRTWHSGNE